MNNCHTTPTRRQSGTTKPPTRGRDWRRGGLGVAVVGFVALLAPSGPAAASTPDDRVDVPVAVASVQSQQTGSLSRMAPDSTRLLLGGGLVALGLGSISAVMTRPRRDDDRSFA